MNSIASCNLFFDLVPSGRERNRRTPGSPPRKRLGRPSKTGGNHGNYVFGNAHIIPENTFAGVYGLSVYRCVVLTISKVYIPMHLLV